MNFLNKLFNRSAHDFFEACFSGDLERVKALLRSNKALAFKPLNDRRSLGVHCAAAIGNAQIVELLLADGSVVNATDADDRTPLHYAAEVGKNNAAVLVLLLANGAAVNARDKEGNTPLHLAATSGSDDSVRFLLANAADAGALNNQQQTPACSAEANHRYGTASIIEESLWGIHEAVEHAGWKKTKSLLSSDHSLVSKRDSRGNLPLHVAVLHHREDFAAFLLENGADVNAKDSDENTPLHRAYETDDKKLAALLISKGADLKARNKHGKVPVDLSPENIRAEWMLHRADIHTAASSGCLERVCSLLKSDPNQVFSTDKFGRTPLFQAASGGHAAVTELLLANKAAVDFKDQSGHTPLFVAVEHAQYGIAKLLFANGANVNARNARGRTPLHIAATEGCAEAVQLLLDHGADVNARDSAASTVSSASFFQSRSWAPLEPKPLFPINPRHQFHRGGATPLHLAAEYGRKAVVELLLANGAQAYARDNGSYRPLDMVRVAQEELAESMSKPARGINMVAVNADSKRQALMEVGKLIYERAKVINRAAAKGDATKVQELVIADPSLVFSTLDNHQTPLHVAALKGHKAVAEILIANKADVNEDFIYDYDKDHRMGTPLSFAIYGRHKDVADLLRQYGGIE